MMKTVVTHDTPIHKGSCLCGGVKFETSATLPPLEACHCDDCRKFTGHFFVSVEIPTAALRITGEVLIKWYQQDDRVRRGFCSNCGSSLFWDPFSTDWMAVSAGLFDTAIPMPIKKHIWVADKPGYYELTDGASQHQH